MKKLIALILVLCLSLGASIALADTFRQGIDPEYPPFSYLDDTATLPEIWNGVMDLVYRVGNEWHIVDYKTNAGSEDWDAHYANQLDAYKKAFTATTGIDVADALTYHIAI